MTYQENSQMIKRILLYGDSIFLTGLAAQLQARDDVDVRQQAPHAGPLDLGDLDAVIVDLTTCRPPTCWRCSAPAPTSKSWA